MEGLYDGLCLGTECKTQTLLGLILLEIVSLVEISEVYNFDIYFNGTGSFTLTSLYKRTTLLVKIIKVK